MYCFAHIADELEGISQKTSPTEFYPSQLASNLHQMAVANARFRRFFEVSIHGKLH
jgi:hypothetical protein